MSTLISALPVRVTDRLRSFVLFLVFFRYKINPDDRYDGVGVGRATWHTALLVACLTLLHGLAVIIITGILSTVAKEHLAVWANALGVMAASLATVQYIPQIYTTYMLKQVGSLSIPMMCIQTPGGFLFAGSLFARLGWDGWSSWGIFVLTASMQGILLCLGIYYEYQTYKEQLAVRTPSPLLGRSESLSHLNSDHSDDEAHDFDSSESDSDPATPELRNPVGARRASINTALLPPPAIGDHRIDYGTHRA